MIYCFLLGIWKQPFPCSNLPAQDARDWFLGSTYTTRVLHKRACRHVCSWSGVPFVWGSRSQLQTSKYSYQRLSTGMFIYHIPSRKFTTFYHCCKCSTITFPFAVGVHLPFILEEQGSASENPNGGYKESVSLSLREQYQETTKTLCWLQTYR